jgi:hypothetical protein
MTWWKETSLFPAGSPERGGGAGDNYPGLRPGDIPAWEPRFEYDAGREVLAPDGSYYRCLEDHIASEAFATDSTKWEVFGGPGVDTNDQDLVLDGDGVTLRLRNGSSGGVPVPDKLVDLTPFVNPPMKSGVISNDLFLGNPRRATVVFGTPFVAGTNYSPNAMCQFKDHYAISIDNVTLAGFDIVLNSKQAPQEDVLWTAIKHGEY